MDLAEIRKELDLIDSQIVLLLAQRMSLIPKVAEAKIRDNLPRYQPDREQQVIEVKRKLAEQHKMNPDLVESIYWKIIEDAHRIEKEIMKE